MSHVTVLERWARGEQRKETGRMERNGSLAVQVQCSFSPDDFAALRCCRLRTGGGLEQSCKLATSVGLQIRLAALPPSPIKGTITSAGFFLSLAPLRLGPGLSQRLWSHPGSEEALTPFSTGPQAGMAHPLPNTDACLFSLCSLRVFTGYPGLEVWGQSDNLGP